MRWQPFYQFKTGMDAQEWNALSTSEQRRVLRESRKTKPPVVESEDPIAVEEQSSLEIRYVSQAELDGMPVYQNNRTV